MTETELFAHYEKVYYHEVGRKEQIFSRLNIPLAVMVAIVGFYAVIIASNYRALSLGGAIWFWVVMGLSIAALIIGAGFFVDALLGRMDKAPAVPNDLEKWRRDLINHYSGSPNADALVAKEVRDAVSADFMNCASILTLNNDRKASSLYYCNLSVIVAVFFAAIAYAIVKMPAL